MLKKVTKTIIYSAFLVIFMNFIRCKSQKFQKKAPFTITEKTYFDWVGGQKGSQGTTINIIGEFKKNTPEFSSIYFQKHKYTIVPQIKGNTFSLTGNSSIFEQEMTMSDNNVDEYGNKPPKLDKDFPFNLQKNEAVIEYEIKGKTYFYTVTEIKQLETVYYP